MPQIRLQQSYQYNINLTDDDSGTNPNGKEWGGNIYVG